MQSIKVKTFKVGVDSDESINDFLASVRAVREGISLLSTGDMQIIYNDLETKEEEAERLHGLSKESQIIVLRKKLSTAEESYFNQIIQINETKITLSDMNDMEGNKATKDAIEKQTTYLESLEKEEKFMKKTLESLRELIIKVNNGEFVI